VRSRLPSTTSLIVFEAAARHLSFTRAAIELNLTQTAISHQIRKIEDLVGTRLFERHGNNVKLTDAATDYLATVRAALSQISAATDRVAEANDERMLTIQCLGTFAIKRLLPMLPEFKRRHPGISIRLTTVQSFQPLAPHSFDVGIWHGTGGWPNVLSDRLCDEEIFPVCSAELAKRAVLDHPRDLAGKTVIRTASPILADEWPFWLDHAGVTDLSFEAEFTCDYLVTSMQAAADGLGIALGRSSVVSEDLRSGRLIEPFSIRAASKAAYYLVVPVAATTSGKAQLFRHWFLNSVGASDRDDLNTF
jgi:LysR family transcriptional regulator, glycine cleavage system transcriptional activator